MKKVLLFAGLAITLGSCYNDSYDKLYPTQTVVTCDTTTVGFAADIKPIFAANCSVNSSDCHSAGSAGGINLNIYSPELTDQVSNGKLLKDINFVSGANAMPKNGSKMGSCDINKITRWVNQGGLNN